MTVTYFSAAFYVGRGSWQTPVVADANRPDSALSMAVDQELCIGGRRVLGDGGTTGPLLSGAYSSAYSNDYERP